MKIEIKKATNREHYFVIIADNGQIIAVSETYKNKKDCISTATLIKEKVFLAEIIDTDSNLLID